MVSWCQTTLQTDILGGEYPPKQTFWMGPLGAGRSPLAGILKKNHIFRFFLLDFQGEKGCCTNECITNFCPTTRCRRTCRLMIIIIINPFSRAIAPNTTCRLRALRAEGPNFNFIRATKPLPFVFTVFTIQLRNHSSSCSRRTRPESSSFEDLISPKVGIVLLSFSLSQITHASPLPPPPSAVALGVLLLHCVSSE